MNKSKRILPLTRQTLFFSSPEFLRVRHGCLKRCLRRHEARMPCKMLAENNGITIAQYAMVAEHLARIVRSSV
jgi:hypothetical protein